MRVEHEYHRRGAWAYVAAWVVHRARLFGRCEAGSGIAAFDRLVDQVTQEPYRSARRVFWVMDNGSTHRGATGDVRLRDHWPTLVPVHTPCHASWLNQSEIYSSIRGWCWPARKVTNRAVAKRLHVSSNSVCKWRERFRVRRLPGLTDEPRPGAPRKATDDRIVDVMTRTLQGPPAHATQWTTRSLGRRGRPLEGHDRAHLADVWVAVASP